MRRALILVAVFAAVLSVPAALAAPKSVEVRVKVGAIGPNQVAMHWISDGQSEVDNLSGNYQKIVRPDAGTCVRFWRAGEKMDEGSCYDAGPIRYSCQRLDCVNFQSGADKVEIEISAPRHKGHQPSS